MKGALRIPALSIVCELQFSSPSKGIQFYDNESDFSVLPKGVPKKPTLLGTLQLEQPTA